jgi:hypothetical protein
MFHFDGFAKKALSLSPYLKASSKTQGEALIFYLLQIDDHQKLCSYTPKTLNLTAGNQGELVWDMSKALVKVGGRGDDGKVIIKVNSWR